jgi:hypothetical protein
VYAQIHLEAINAKTNTFRGYTLILSYNLFKDIHLQIFYGRLSRLSHKRSMSFSSLHKAFETIHQILKKRLSSMHRIGCAYTLNNVTIDMPFPPFKDLESLMDLLSLFPRSSSKSLH